MNFVFFRNLVVFNVLVIVLILSSLHIWKPVTNFIDTKPKKAIDISTILNQWDTANYNNICTKSYVNESYPYPKSIMLAAFYPGLPIVICIGKFLNISHFAYLVISALFLVLGCLLCVFLDKIWNTGNLRSKLSVKDNYPDNINSARDNNQNFLLWSYLLFPFSAFLHFNYTEIYFMVFGLAIFILIHYNKIWQSQIFGLLIGFFRPNAGFFGILSWVFWSLKYLKQQSDCQKSSSKSLANSYVSDESKSEFGIHSSFKLQNIKSKLFSSHFLNLDYLFRSFGFLSYSLGSLCLFSFHYFKYGNWHLFFDAQRDFFAKKVDLNIAGQFWNDILGKRDFFFLTAQIHSQTIEKYGFWFYDKEFYIIFCLVFPLIVAIVGSIVLIKQKKWYWFIYSWFMLLPTLISTTDSFNRYLIMSFPLILAFNSLFSRTKLARILLLCIYGFFFGMSIVLFTHGFWVG